MVTPVIMDFRILSYFLLIWHDRAWQFILKSIISSYGFLSFFRYLTLKLEKLRQPVTKYIDTIFFCKGFPLPPFHQS